jgi:hypothetical protein
MLSSQHLRTSDQHHPLDFLDHAVIKKLLWCLPRFHVTHPNTIETVAAPSISSYTSTKHTLKE